MKNYTAITFILVGLTDNLNMQIMLFIFLFLTYSLSVVDTLTIITLTLVDSHPKTPLYFFPLPLLHFESLIFHSIPGFL